MKTRLIAIGILIGMLIEFAIIAMNAPITGGCKTEIDTLTIKRELNKTKHKIVVR